MRHLFVTFAIVSLLLVLALGYFVSSSWYWVLVGLIPIILWGFYDMTQKKHAIVRNFPILGRTRYLLEDLRPKIYQYFIESDINGRPFNRLQRSVVYARAKKELETVPFGSQLDFYKEGYEWMHHSISPKKMEDLPRHPRVLIGEELCSQPYDCSLFNVSAMSFGSLSSNAVLALNKGAKAGGFAQNTGEGGIAPYHLEHGGDLIFQFGTGYFGCRNEDGDFSPEAFKKTASHASVKMIELKLSQGAKPGHGGILPAKKNTEEISKIRGVKVGIAVHSPPYHKAFSTPKGLLKFITELRELSGGKPIGFKLCVGAKHEFLAICKAMQSTGQRPDFISIDGGEGGTGAAPLEFSNSVGMPFKEGLAFAYNALRGFDLHNKINLIAAGKITTGFDMFRAFSLGASATYSARAMMMALGCIQALECNTNTCPTGVATQDKELMAGLHVGNKADRVASYHKETIESFSELLAASGATGAKELNRAMIYRRLNMHESQPYSFIYPYIPVGSLLVEDNSPKLWRYHMEMADEDSFTPKMSIVS